MLVESAKAPPPNHVSFKVDFHALIGEAVNNDFLRVVLLAMHNVVRWHVPLENLSEADVKATAQAHRKIASAIADGDEAKAERAMRLHLQRFADTMAQQGRLLEPIIPVHRWRTEVAHTWTT